MSVPLPVDDDGFTVYLPPRGLSVELATFDDALDFILLLQPDDDAVVALLDDLRHVLVVIETAPANLSQVPALAAAIEPVAAAVVFTATSVDDAPPEDALVDHHRLGAAFAEVGLRLVDWLHVDDHLVRSLAETAAGTAEWGSWPIS